MLWIDAGEGSKAPGTSMPAGSETGSLVLLEATQTRHSNAGIAGSSSGHRSAAGGTVTIARTASSRGTSTRTVLVIAEATATR
jgi:hypothetical protein